jgi:hypothetical protein
MKSATFILGCFLGIFLQAGAQSLIVRTTDGSTHEYDLKDIESISFSGSSGYQSYCYDFETGDLSGWDGPANAEIIGGTLHLWGISGYLYRPIEPSGATHFVRGTVEFDIKPGSGDYVFETKGEAEQNGLCWAACVRWRNGTIQVHQWDGASRILLNTGVPYETDLWYHARMALDKDLGQTGRFSLWLRPLEGSGDEVFVGEFDFEAMYGKMEGVNQISLGVYDMQGTTIQHVYFDNIYFHMTP